MENKNRTATDCCFHLQRSRLTLASGRPSRHTGTELPRSGRWRETTLHDAFQVTFRGREDSTIVAPLFSVKIESGPQPLTFTLIWCWGECRDSYFNLQQKEKKKKELSALPWLYPKPFGSTASTWSINRATWRETSERLQGWLMHPHKRNLFFLCGSGKKFFL